MFRTTFRPLRPHARAGNALSEGRASLGRTHRLGPRPGQELAADGVWLADPVGGLASGARLAIRCAARSRRGSCRSIGSAQAQAVAPADRRLSADRSADRLSPRALHRGGSRHCRPIRSSCCARTGCAPTTSPPIAARAALNDYARTNDPFAKLGKLQVSVEVSSVIRASPDSLPRRLDRAPLTRTAACARPSAGPRFSPS